MGENINTDKSIREKLENFSVQPPTHVWDNVQEVLAVQRRKRRIVLARWISAAAVVALAFIAGWYLNDSKEVTVQMETEQMEDLSGAKDDILSAEPSDETIDLAKSEPAEKEVEPKTSLVAASFEPTEKASVNMVSSGPRRVSMNYMPAKEAWLKSDRSEVYLEEKFVYATDRTIHEQEEVLIAENVKTIKAKTEKEKGWIVGMHISPSYSSHAVSHTEQYAQNMNYSGENGNGNVGGGLSVQYKTGKKLRIESGVYYAQNGQTSENSFRFMDYLNSPAFGGGYEYDKNYELSTAPPSFSNSVDVSNGNMAMNSTAGVIAMRGTPKGATITSDPESVNSGFSNALVTDGEFSQVFDFIEVPLYVRYSLLDKKLGFEILGGLNAGVVVGNNAYIDNSYGLQNIGKTEDISKLNVSGTVGVGMNYSFGRHFSVALEPRFNYYFNSINKNEEVTYRPYRLGLYTGLYYEF